MVVQVGVLDVRVVAHDVCDTQMARDGCNNRDGWEGPKAKRRGGWKPIGQKARGKKRSTAGKCDGNMGPMGDSFSPLRERPAVTSVFGLMVIKTDGLERRP